MKMIPLIIFLTACLAGAAYCCFAANYPNTSDATEGSSQANQLAAEAANTFAQLIKPSYKTLNDFIADYSSGKEQLEAQLDKTGTTSSDQTQSRDILLKQIASYNARIKYLINHNDFDARVQPQYQSVLASMNAQKNMLSPPAWTISQRNYAKGLEQMYSPDKAMEKAKQDVLYSDNEQAKQLRAERDKLQCQVDSINTVQQRIQNKILELKAKASATYTDYVGQKVTALTNTSSALKNSAMAFLNKEKMNDRITLLDLHTRALVQNEAARPISAPMTAPMSTGSQDSGVRY